MSHFVALDIKLANLHLASICDIAVADVDPTDGGAWQAKVWHTLINPQDYFDPFCIAQHGIEEADVAGAPTFEQVVPALCERLRGQVVLTYTHFDRTSLSRALTVCMDEALPCQWLDVARVVRHSWHDLARSGYGIYPVTKKLGIACDRHRALDHAIATANVLLIAMQTTGIPLAEWPRKVEQPISADGLGIAREGRPDGPLHGEVVVFTGALSLTRVEAAALAARAGCDVEEGVSKRTTILVVGNQDLRQLAGYTKSSKHRKVEELASKGQPVRVLFERDFFAAVTQP
jgi:DNA polymerase-3 subunit epsilon